MVQSYYGTSLNNRKELTDTPNLDESTVNYVEEKPIPKVYILYGFICIALSQWQSYRNEEQISGPRA